MFLVEEAEPDLSLSLEKYEWQRVVCGKKVVYLWRKRQIIINLANHEAFCFDSMRAVDDDSSHCSSEHENDGEDENCGEEQLLRELAAGASGDGNNG